MKTWNKAYVVLTLFVGLSFLVSSCTDLSENPYSQVTSDNFFQTDEQFSAAIGAVYTQLSAYGDGPFLYANEWSTDEFIVPQRGSDWYDGGVYIRAKRHTWTPDDGYINDAWNFLFSGVSTSNRLISQLNTLAEQGKITNQKAGKYLPEIKVMRSFYYFWLMDMYGNVPLVSGFKDAEKSPPNSSDFQKGRMKIYTFVKKEIYDNMDSLSTAVDQTTYGRMTTWGAHFLLAKLYLNAGVYNGSDKFTQANLDSALANCNAIINSGKFSLTTNYFDNFKKQNSNSPEFIFAIPYDNVKLQGYQIPTRSLHYLDKQRFNLKVQPYNGYASQENFYNSFKSNDIRKTGFIKGFQKSASGQYLIDNASFPGSPHGDTLYLSPHINELQPKAWRDAGVRFNKFRIGDQIEQNLSNDFPIFRYTDVLLMKAEILWRKNSGDPEALRLVNMVRERAGLSDYSSLNARRLLYERGHEFYIEAWRRQDLIRFKGGLHYKYDSKGNKGSKYAEGQKAFNDAWRFKKVDPDGHVDVYPIPTPQLDANSNLNQNPGY